MTIKKSIYSIIHFLEGFGDGTGDETGDRLSNMTDGGNSILSY